jgi:lipoprotein-anchoring transpeptidase ErfK/SrfK
MVSSRTRSVAACLVAILTASQAGGDVPLQFRLEWRSPEAAPLVARYSPAQLALLEKINRTDAAHLANATRLVIPDDWTLDERAYGPFPVDYVAAQHEPQLLLVHLATQAFAAYESGRLIRWGPISSGSKVSPTPAGRFALEWRSTGHASSINPAWYMRWYFNFSQIRGLAFHEYALPGRPASHGCIRMLTRDARWLFDWGRPGGRGTASGGTPVVILGGYDYSSDPPWLDATRLRMPLDLPDQVP